MGIRSRDRQPLIIRFEKKVYRTPNCWFFTGKILNSGYGIMRVNCRSRVATHVSWFLKYGHWPPSDKFVLHKCDIRQCVNPDHLFLGTQKENLKDRNDKGYTDRKLTPGQELEICALWPARSKVSLAREYGIGETTVTRILIRTKK